MHKKKELVKNTIIIFLGKISTQFISFFLLPLYTSFLSTSAYGTVDLITTYVSLFVPVITLQQEMATFRYLIDARKSENKIKNVITTSILNVIKLLILFVIFYFIVLYFLKFNYACFILANITVCIFSNLFLQIARGLGSNIHYSIASFITGVVTIILNIIFIVFLKFKVEGMLLSIIIANTFCVIYLFFALKIYKYISFKSNKTLRKQMLKYSLPLVPNGISWWIVSASDRTIISTFLGVAANGVYAVANKFPTIINSLFSIFTMSWTESASLHINDNDRDIFFSDVANTVLRLFSCLCIGLIACMPYIFPILIDDKFLEAYMYIPIFLVGVLCNCIICVYSAIYIAKKLTKQVASTSIMSALINIIFNLLFIKFLGLYAACFATSIAYLLMMIYRHIDLKKYVNIKYQESIIILTIIMFMISIVFYYLNKPNLNILNLIIVIIYSFVINKKLLLEIKKYLEKQRKIFKKLYKTN